MKHFIVISLIVAVGYAELDKAFKEKILKQAEEELTDCVKKEAVTKEDFDEFIGNGTITRRGAKCLGACVNEQEGVQDRNGKLSLDGGIKSIEDYKNADADIYSKMKQVITKCVEKVGDPGDRCETAAKYLECTYIVSVEVGLPSDLLSV